MWTHLKIFAKNYFPFENCLNFSYSVFQEEKILTFKINEFDDDDDDVNQYFRTKQVLNKYTN